MEHATRIYVPQTRPDEDYLEGLLSWDDLQHVDYLLALLVEQVLTDDLVRLGPTVLDRLAGRLDMTFERLVVLLDYAALAGLISDAEPPRVRVVSAVVPGRWVRLNFTGDAARAAGAEGWTV